MATSYPAQGVGDAFVRIVREDGVSGLFRGATPTIVRAMALNMGMLASNDQVRGCSLPTTAPPGGGHSEAAARTSLSAPSSAAC